MCRFSQYITGQTVLEIQFGFSINAFTVFLCFNFLSMLMEHFYDGLSTKSLKMKLAQSQWETNQDLHWKLVLLWLVLICHSDWFEKRLLRDVLLSLFRKPPNKDVLPTDVLLSDALRIGISPFSEHLNDCLLIRLLICSISLFITWSRTEWPVESAMNDFILSSSRNKSSFWEFFTRRLEYK